MDLVGLGRTGFDWVGPNDFCPGGRGRISILDWTRESGQRFHVADFKAVLHSFVLPRVVAIYLVIFMRGIVRRGVGHLRSHPY